MPAPPPVPTRVLLVTLALLPLTAMAAHDTGAPRRPRGEQTRTLFGPVQLREVLGVLRRQHLRPSLDTPLPWAAAANGALAAAGGRWELLPLAWLKVQAAGRARFQGETRPLRCGGEVVAGVVLHAVPREGLGAGDRARAAGRAEPLVEALRAWKVPFGPAAFRCVVDLAIRLRTGGGGGGEAARARGASAVWLRATRHLLRAVDPHTKLTTARAWGAVERSFTEILRLGLTFAWRGGAAVVEAISSRSPEIASVEVGDVLRAIDGRSVAGASRSAIVQRLRRPAGAVVRLTFAPAAGGPTYTVALTFLSSRETDVSAYDIEGLDRCVRVRIRKFADGTARRVAEALDRFEADKGGLRGAVLDMRGNRGGLIPEAVSLLELFRSGGLIGRVQTTAGTEALAISRRRRRVRRTPLVVLVDRRCASACEFVTASLKDGRRALIVGERTWGKATLQEYLALKTTGARLMVTVAMFHSPGGHAIQAHGVPPDLDTERGRAPRVRGEAAMAFHLVPDLSESAWGAHPKIGAIRACWKAATAALPPEARGPRRAAEALRCLLSTPGRWGQTLP